MPLRMLLDRSLRVTPESYRKPAAALPKVRSATPMIGVGHWIGAHI